MRLCAAGSARDNRRRHLVPVLLHGGLVMMVLVTSTLLGAQTLPPVFDPTLRSGEPSGPLKKKFVPPSIPPPSPLLPPVPATPPDGESQPQLGQIQVLVKTVRVTGNTVFSEAKIEAVTKPYENQVLTTEDLERLRLALTLLYVNEGYITSGAVIPDQDVVDGVIQIQIIEGALSQIDIEGNNWFRRGTISDRLALGAGPPLRMEPLQTRLQLLQQDPRIERINAELRPGDRRGESILHVNLKEQSPWKMWAEFSNYQTPAVGAERGLLTVAHQNVTGRGDPLSITYGGSRGVHPVIDVSYTIPINRYDTTFTASYRRNDFVVVESQFRQLNLNSTSEIIGFTLRHPIYRTLTDELAVAITGERLYNKVTSIFDRPDLSSPFINGSSDTGVSAVSALRFVQEYVHRTSTSVIAVRSRFSLGLDVLNATTNSGLSPTGPLPDGRFFSWLGQLQGIRRFDDWWGMQLLGQLNLQFANDRLFPLEQIPLGGRFSVRGYRENTLIRDNGFLFSVESRFPLLRYATGEPLLQFAQFIDVGRAWQAKGKTDDPQTLASIGLGLRWTVLPKDRARFELYWGVPLNHVPHPAGNLQDHGIHLQAVVQVF
ncbi:MAG TPA: ShlB/FhaC/HecB family hemolysin secretion/activation protein [Nitrospira sp.]|nr:ShlB/FhaC/HecB family hemolysin secretion/activation protein [Nitrospira sp.]